MKKRLLSLIILIVFCTSVSYASDTNYDDITFPQWTKDLRRTSIISFGSLPFVTLWVTVGYAAAVHGSFHNPMDKSTSSFTTDEQKEIIEIAALISLGLGITDLIINIVRRNVSTKKQDSDSTPIKIIPLKETLRLQQQENPPEEDINMPDDLNGIRNPGPEKEYLQGGLIDAIF